MRTITIKSANHNQTLTISNQLHDGVQHLPTAMERLFAIVETATLPDGNYSAVYAVKSRLLWEVEFSFFAEGGDVFANDVEAAGAVAI
jgi:hypothetical protein